MKSQISKKKKKKDATRTHQRERKTNARGKSMRAAIRANEQRRMKLIAEQLLRQVRLSKNPTSVT